MTIKARRAARRGEKDKDGKPPDWLRVVSRLEIDIKALIKLTFYEKPPDVPVRALNPKAVYIIGNALEAGFGSCCGIQGDEIIFSEFGRWSRGVTEEKSSSF